MGKLSGILRIRILERDHYTCVYCGARPPDVTLEVDHILPRIDGGRDVATNLVTACRRCNNGKRTNLIALPEGYVPGDLPQRFGRMFQRRALGLPTERIVPLDLAPRVACDECGTRADTAHFLPWIAQAPSHVAFKDVWLACPAHDFGGYWIYLRDLDDPRKQFTMRDHLRAKNGGPLFLMRLDERLAGAPLREAV